MRFHRQRRRYGSKRLWLLVLVLILFATLFISKASVPASIVRIVHAAGIPLWETHDAVERDVRGLLWLFRPKGALIAEHQKLQKEYQALQGKFVDQVALWEENKRLSEILGRITERRYLAAGVLLHPHASPFDTLILDIGAVDGVVKEQEVFASERTYIGEIDEVYPKTSRVRLVSSPGQETRVVLDESDVPLTALGAGGGNITIVVPRDVPVSVGERVWLPGLTRYLVGVVGSIEVRPADAFQTVSVVLPINIYTIREALILHE